MDEDNFDDIRWWDPKASDMERVHRLRAATSACELDDKHRRHDILHRVKMYGNRQFAGLHSAKTSNSRRGRFNIVKAGCDTVANRLSGNRPKATPMPISGSNWSLRRRARLLDRFIQGQMRVSNARERMLQALSDAVIAGDGLVKVGHDTKQITLERTFAADLSVPPLEARAGSPMTMYQRHFVDRGVLLARYPKAAKKLKDADRAFSDDLWHVTGIDKRADQLEVVEGWRLPSVTGGKDGMYVVAAGDVVLHREAWAHDYFPFVHISWDRPFLGYWSDSAVDIVEGQQIEINGLVAKVARGNDLGGHTVIFTPMGTEDNFNPRKMSNQPFTTVPFQGDKPIFETIHAVSPDARAQIQELRDQAFWLLGLYEGGAAGIPGGLESGEAVSRWNDLGAIRYRRFSERFELAHVALARQLIDRARDLAKLNPDFAVPNERDRFSMARIDWAEVDMEDDQYVLQVYPMSSLPDDPAGRVASVERLVVAGIIPREQAAHLLNFPDLEGSFLSLDRAAYENIEWAIEIMLDEGRRMVPHPFQDLKLALKLVQAHVLQAEMWGAPEDRQQLLRDYSVQIQVLLESGMRKQQQLAMEAGAATGGLRSGPAGAAPPQGVAGVAPTAAGEEVLA